MNLNDIEQYDNYKRRHGYWEIYNVDGTLFYIASYHHGKYIGYVQINWNASARVNKTYYIL